MDNYVVLQVNKKTLKLLAVVLSYIVLFVGTKAYYYKRGAMDAIQYLMQGAAGARSSTSAENSHDGSSI